MAIRRCDRALASEKDAAGEQMTFDRTVLGVDILRRTLTTLRIIVAALAMGVIVFGVIAVGQNLNKPHSLIGKLDPQNLTFLVMGVITLAMGLVVPRIVLGSQLKAPTTPPPGLTPEQFKAATPELLRIDAILQRVQTSTIVGCALFEAGAFANVFGYMQSRELAHLVLAGLLVLAILAQLPTETRLERCIEDALRRFRDQDSFAKP